MPTAIVQEDRRRELLENGYTIFKNVLPLSMVEELRAISEELADQFSPTDKEKYKYQGTNISFNYTYPLFAKLVAWPASLEALRSLGYPAPKFLIGFILSKPPKAPALYWHQDWMFWSDPVSLDRKPAQLFLMYYLTDTTPENGCLKVIPGTHCRRIPLHAQLPEAHTDATFSATNNADSPLFRQHPNEVNIAVKAGDLVVGDARVLHAAHSNETEKRRTCLVLWWVPAYAELPDSIKSSIRQQLHDLPDPLSEEDKEMLKELLPDYQGSAEPAEWNRNPGEYLK